MERVQWYRCRWHIEVFHMVLKSGCKVEDCRLGTAERLIRYLTLCSVIAWRLYWLTHMNRHYPDAPCIAVLAEHEWEGNVRELEHAIEHAVALASGEEIGVSDLPASVRGGGAPGGDAAAGGPASFKDAKEQVIERFEREFLSRALERHRGNVTRAAEEIGMYRQQLQSKVAKLGIDLESLRRS